MEAGLSRKDPLQTILSSKCNPQANLPIATEPAKLFRIRRHLQRYNSCPLPHFLAFAFASSRRGDQGTAHYSIGAEECHRTVRDAPLAAEQTYMLQLLDRRWTRSSSKVDFITVLLLVTTYGSQSPKQALASPQGSP